jgi:FlaA1/EpsC-like NDP-sugar epimerase
MKNNKTIILFVVDLTCLCLAYIGSYLFRFDFDLLNKINLQHAAYVLGISLVAYMGMFFAFKMQRIIWRYASLHEMVRIAASVFCGFVLTTIAAYSVFGVHYVPLSILPLHAFFYLALLVASRAMYRMYRLNSDNEIVSKKVLIIGAGQAADGILRDMLQHSERGYKPVGILDDDKSLHNRVLRGVRVLGGTDNLKGYLLQLKPDMVVFAIPSIANNSLLNHIYDACGAANIPLRVLPGLSHLTQGRINIDALQKVEIEDLLGREPVSIINSDLIECLHYKDVLVTGAGGSIGFELCYQIAMNRPKSLSLVDNCEYNLYTCHAELTKKFPALEITMSLADVSCADEIDAWFNEIKPQVVFHAAAFKHVPLLENQVFNAVKNNVLGTQLVCDLADKYNVESFVLVSTDKAVNPTNVMGMTKRIAEIYCQTKNSHSKTNFITVRFGNVLGSNGSVLPLFREQLAAGGPLTVTHPDMTRYFMMIPEAVTLILQSFLQGAGGEIFVLEMGKPVKIVDLAEKLITLSGQRPYQQVDIKFTGMRPGEKLFEEIFHGTEKISKTNNEKILIADCRQYQPDIITLSYRQILHHYSARSLNGLLGVMLDLVPEYKGSYSNIQCQPVVQSDLVES